MNLKTLSREQLEAELLGESEERTARPGCDERAAVGYAGRDAQETTEL